MPTLSWARIAFEEGAFEWLRRIAIKNGYLNLVPMPNGPGGYMVVDKLYMYDFRSSVPDVMPLSMPPIETLE
eukprot:11447735-Karenia_brevis.AAC.1